MIWSWFLSRYLSKHSSQAQQAIPVVAEVIVRDVEAVYRTLGKILAQQDAIVTVDKPARITRTRIGNGDRVKEGQVLFVLESAVETHWRLPKPD